MEQISIQVTQLRRTGKQRLKQKNRIPFTVVWKIIILSIAIVIASFIIAGAIVATQVLSGNLNIGDIQGEGFGNSRQEPAPITGNGTIVRIVDDAGSNSYSPNPIEVNVGQTITWVTTTLSYIQQPLPMESLIPIYCKEGKCSATHSIQ